MSAVPKQFDIRVSAILANGDLVSLHCAAFMYSDGEVYWNYDHLVAAQFATRKHLRVWQMNRESRDKLAAVVNDLGLDFEASFAPSRKMCQASDRFCASPYSRDCQCTNTSLFVLQLAFWSCFCWRGLQKERASAMGESFFEQMLPPGAFTARDVGDLLEAARGKCTKDGSHCSHIVPGALREKVSSKRSCQAGFFALLADLLLVAAGCESAKHMLLCMLGVVCDAIDEQLDQTCTETPPHKAYWIGRCHAFWFRLWQSRPSSGTLCHSDCPLAAVFDTPGTHSQECLP